MANPNSRQSLADYCLRQLGAPVIEVNVDDDQLDDRIDEAIQYYQQYHADATMRNYLKHQITSTDVTNKYITIPDNILYIRRMFPLAEENSSISMFDARYQIHLNDIFDLGHMGNLANYVQIQQYLTTLDMFLNGEEQFRFNRHINRAYLDVNWERDVTVGRYVVLDVTETVNPTAYTDVYNDMFLKRYTTALIKRQWGQNLMKFEGMQLPGGVTMNGRQIYEDALQDIEKLEEEMRLGFEMPSDFFMG
ncbi:MAG: hypothetical protein CBB72_016470 [Muricauda sp. TMED12]|nr:MAG: hypothetical protein CBB72_016470 [Muricauda sp. TMED12]